MLYRSPIHTARPPRGLFRIARRSSRKDSHDHRPAIYIILDRGKANGLMQRAREIGVRRHHLPGEGTMSSPILEFFGIN